LWGPYIDCVQVIRGTVDLIISLLLHVRCSSQPSVICFVDGIPSNISPSRPKISSKTGIQWRIMVSSSFQFITSSADVLRGQGQNPCISDITEHGAETRVRDIKAGEIDSLNAINNGPTLFDGSMKLGRYDRLLQMMHIIRCWRSYFIE
jgi:hypothetical protein